MFCMLDLSSVFWLLSCIVECHNLVEQSDFVVAISASPVMVKLLVVLALQSSSTKVMVEAPSTLISGFTGVSRGLSQ